MGFIADAPLCGITSGTRCWALTSLDTTPSGAVDPPLVADPVVLEARYAPLIIIKVNGMQQRRRRGTIRYIPRRGLLKRQATPCRSRVAQCLNHHTNCCCWPRPIRRVPRRVSSPRHLCDRRNSQIIRVFKRGKRQEVIAHRNSAHRNAHSCISDGTTGGDDRTHHMDRSTLHHPLRYSGLP